MTEIKKHNILKIQEQNTYFKNNRQFWVKDLIVTDDRGSILVLKLFSEEKVNITILQDFIEGEENDNDRPETQAESGAPF